jgi:uncharacterized protein (DUF885 family)
VWVADLAERAHGDPAIGEARYTNLLQLAAGNRYDAGSAHELGLTKLRELRTRLSALPAPDTTAPHARDAAELLDWYRTETARARRFCAEHEVVTLPTEEHCDVVPATADQIALLPVASYVPPPLLADGGTGRFVIPTPVDATPEAVARSLATQRRSGIPTVTVHETYPGHHAHYARMSRRPLRALFTNPFFTEGWGVYTERLAGELGYFTTPAQLRGHLTALLVRAVRATVDPALHSGAMNAQQARTFLTEQLRLPERFTQAEVHRFLAYPTQAASYLVGAVEIAAIVTAARTTTTQTHDALTALGSPPLPLARAALTATP